MEEFQRDFTYRTSLRDDCLHLTATMQDRFHDLEMEVIVDLETMTITGATAEFRRSPSEFCPNVAAGMGKLAGTVIGRGMNRRLLELFGGGEGCGNIRTILSGLLPLALNVRAARGIENEEELLDTISRKLGGSCAGYPSPGTQP
ncbi:MAG TPA: DUF2889 domain-containing protein [Geobacteraceae bacterium]|nr:DUF2889 domain-containing protein [Geobacteraceae bacterium]